jgi:hypothetical protein
MIPSCVMVARILSGLYVARGRPAGATIAAPGGRCAEGDTAMAGTAYFADELTALSDFDIARCAYAIAERLEAENVTRDELHDPADELRFVLDETIERHSPLAARALLEAPYVGDVVADAEIDAALASMEHRAALRRERSDA